MDRFARPVVSGEYKTMLWLEVLRGILNKVLKSATEFKIAVGRTIKGLVETYKGNGLSSGAFEIDQANKQVFVTFYDTRDLRLRHENDAFRVRLLIDGGNSDLRNSDRKTGLTEGGRSSHHSDVASGNEKLGIFRFRLNNDTSGADRRVVQSFQYSG